MTIAADMCIYTNKNFVVEKIPDDKLLTYQGGNVLSVETPAPPPTEEKKEEPKKDETGTASS